MRFLETEVTRGLGMDGELLLNGYRVSVWGDEILEGFPGGPVVKTPLTVEGAQVLFLVGGTKILCALKHSHKIENRKVLGIDSSDGYTRF